MRSGVVESSALVVSATERAIVPCGLIPCDVAEHSNADCQAISRIEHLQRQNPAPLEEAWAFRHN